MQAPPAAQASDPVAVLKQNLQTSKEALKHYEWIEATTISVNGEEKSKTENRCYYDASGKLTKVATGGGKEEKGPGGLRGKSAAKKKEAMSASAKQSVALLESYFPLDAALIQKAKDEGRFAVRPTDASGKTGIDIKSYKKPGDQVSITWDTKTNQVTNVTISSFLTAIDKDAVNAMADYTAMPDGVSYPASKTLEVKSQALVVKTTNSGYKKS